MDTKKELISEMSLTANNCELGYLRIILTGLKRSDNILKIAAKVGENRVSVSIEITKCISEILSSDLRRLQFQFDTSFFYGRNPPIKQLEDGLTEFLECLKSSPKPVLLITHSAKCESTLLIQMLKEIDEAPKFVNIIAGFSDSFLFLRKKFLQPMRIQKLTLVRLAKDWLGKKSLKQLYETPFDLNVLEELVTKFISKSDLISNGESFTEAITTGMEAENISKIRRDARVLTMATAVEYLEITQESQNSDSNKGIHPASSTRTPQLFREMPMKKPAVTSMEELNPVRPVSHYQNPRKRASTSMQEQDPVHQVSHNQDPKKRAIASMEEQKPVHQVSRYQDPRNQASTSVEEQNPVDWTLLHHRDPRSQAGTSMEELNPVHQVSRYQDPRNQASTSVEEQNPVDWTLLHHRDPRSQAGTSMEELNPVHQVSRYQDPRNRASASMEEQNLVHQVSRYQDPRNRASASMEEQNPVHQVSRYQDAVDQDPVENIELDWEWIQDNWEKNWSLM